VRKIGVLVVIHLLLANLAQAASVDVFMECKQTLDNGVAIYVGYSASEDVLAVSSLTLSDGAYLIGNLPGEFVQGEHQRVFGVALPGDFGEAYFSAQGAEVGTSLMIRSDADLPLCKEEGWRPSAPSILIPADGPGPFLLEIQDDYGHWHLVADDAHPDGIVLYNHAGTVELIGSVGQDEDPAHYRLIEVNND
jgi:hypothetical protein